MVGRRVQQGFSLTELLIVVAVTGILAAIAIANLVDALDRGKQKQTMSDLRSIATGVEAYAIDNNDYPNASGPVSTISADLAPMYLKHVPTHDGWRNDLLYEKLDWVADGAEYTILSLGRDGVDDGGDGNGGETHDLNADIVIFDGLFTQWPAGVQQ